MRLSDLLLVKDKGGRKSRRSTIIYNGFTWKKYEKAVNEGLGRNAKPGKELVHVWTCWRENLPVSECVEDIRDYA